MLLRTPSPRSETMGVDDRDLELSARVGLERPLAHIAPACWAVLFRFAWKHLEHADAHEVRGQLHNISGVSDRGVRGHCRECVVWVEFPLTPPEFMHCVRVRVEGVGSEQLREVVAQ